MKKDTSFLYKQNKSIIMILEGEKSVVLSRKILSSDVTTGKTMFFLLRPNPKLLLSPWVCLPLKLRHKISLYS